MFATCGTEAKRALCEALGAERAINYREDSFADVISELTGGVDVILDIVGATYLDANIKLLNPDGRLVIIAVLGGAKAELNLARVMMNRLYVTGSTLRARDAGFKGTIARALHREVWPLAGGWLGPAGPPCHVSAGRRAPRS